MSMKHWKAGALTVAVMTGALGFTAHADDMKKQEKHMMKEGKAVGEAAAKREKYVGELALFNTQQIDLARMAEAQASSPDVKDFARQLREDHEKNQDALRTWAQGQQMTVSELTDGMSEDTATGGSGVEQGYDKGMKHADKKLGKALDKQDSEMEALRGKQGADFDKAFLSRISKDQKKGKDLLKDGRRSYKNDATFLALLSDTEGVVDGHEMKVKALEKGMKQ
jgi:predicted outer membrane protein